MVYAVARRDRRHSQWGRLQSAQDWEPAVHGKDRRKKSRPDSSQTDDIKCSTSPQLLQAEAQCAPIGVKTTQTWHCFTTGAHVSHW